MPNIPSSSGRHRSSFSSTFSYGPQSLVNSFLASTKPNSPLHSTPNASTSIFSAALDPNGSIFQASPRTKAEVIAGRKSGRRPLSESHNTSILAENDDVATEEESEEWTMLDRMRLWRHDALMQHLYETAAFWGDKILSWTNNPNDAFWLAQTHFMMQQYSRAERLLTRPFPLHPPLDSPFLSHQNNEIYNCGRGLALANGASKASRKGKGREITNQNHLHTQSQLIADPMFLNSQFLDFQSENLKGLMGDLDPDADTSRLVDMSIACRYLAAQCQVQQGKWMDALEMLGESNPFKNSGRSGPTVPNRDGGIKIEASMCHLRGLLMLKLNRNDRAKECFLEALSLDVKCYDAFEQLISGELMRPDEGNRMFSYILTSISLTAQEWGFIQGLLYTEQTPEDAEFIRLIYIIRLRKFKHMEEISLACARLVDEYGLGENIDVLFGFADMLYSQYRWADCYAVTSRILEQVSVHAPTMPLHIACMHHLPYLHSKLFMIAHELVEKEPEIAISWYAVAVWYLTSRKYGEARKYFSKTSLMDPRFSPAWIAFGHAFAIEGEHDHAITAYSTSSRLFQGSHLPLLYVGMEHLCLSQWDHAREALTAAFQMCDSDPLLINELGVMAYHRREYAQACVLFAEALKHAQIDQSSKFVWATTYVNLGSACRKLGHLVEAKRHYLKVLEIDPRHSVALAFLGMVHHLMDHPDQAIIRYHEVWKKIIIQTKGICTDNICQALSIDPLNMHTLELLNMVLETVTDSPPFGGSVPGGEEVWQKVMKDQAETTGAKKEATKDKKSQTQLTIEPGVRDIAMIDA